MKAVCGQIITMTVVVMLLSCIVAEGVLAAETSCLARVQSNNCQISLQYTKVCDCSNATNLAGLTFTAGSNFDGVNFLGANLKGCNFGSASVKGANFSKADLKNASVGSVTKSSTTNFTCTRWTDGRLCNSKSNAGQCTYQTSSDKPQCNNTFTN